MGRKIIDLIGQTFNRLTVIKRVENNKESRTQWLCECDCDSKKVIVLGNSLRSGNTKSCGCLMIEKVSENGKAKKKYNIYNLIGNFGIGYTLKGEIFYFDLEDYDKIKDYCWHKNKTGYLITFINKKPISMHRLVMNCPDDMEVDHEFHDLWDNRKEFLRIVTKSQNSMNQQIRKDSTSGIKGVSWDNRTNKWHTYINVKNKRIQLGRFDNFEDAVDARKQAEEKYFGEYNLKDKISM